MAIIFAGNQGYIDDLEVVQVGGFCHSLREYLKAERSDLMEAIRTEKALSAKLEDELRTAIDDFHSSYALEASVTVQQAVAEAAAEASV